MRVPEAGGCPVRGGPGAARGSAVLCEGPCLPATALSLSMSVVKTAGWRPGACEWWGMGVGVERRGLQSAAACSSFGHVILRVAPSPINRMWDPGAEVGNLSLVTGLTGAL